jgi:tetratricopeptide (TPR) repeat protein
MTQTKVGSRVDVDKLELEFRSNPSLYVELAQAYIRRKLPEQAIRVAKEGLKSNGTDPSKAYLALGMAYYHNYDDKNATTYLRKAAKKNPESAVAYRTLGEIYLERGQEQKALSELSKAIELDSSDTHTKALLTALEEKVPEVASTAKNPNVDFWPPRQATPTRFLSKPFSHAIVQVLIVAAIVAGFVFWYQHYTKIRVQVRDHISEATTQLPKDNYANLIKAEESLKKALVLNSGEDKAIVRLSQVQSLLWLNHGLYDRKNEVKKHLDWMEQEELLNPIRFAVKALFLVDEGKPEEAKKLLDEIIKRAIEKQDIFSHAMLLGARGKANLALGKIKEAREDFSAAARTSSDSPRWQSAFADMYLREGNLPRAIKYFRDSNKQKDHIFSALRLAYARLQQGRNFHLVQKTIDEYSDSARHPDDHFSAPLKGLLYLVKAERALLDQDNETANEFAQKSLQAYEKNAEAHGLAGRLAVIAKDEAKVNSSFARALQLDPYLPKLYFDRSESLFALEKKDEAIEKIKEFERYLKPSVAYYIKTGQLLMKNDKMDDALATFQKAVEVDEVDPDARFHVGLCYQKTGLLLSGDKKKTDEKLELYNKARQAYEDALSLPGGERPEIYHMMGLIYLDGEDPNNALANMAKSVMMMQKIGEPDKKVANIYDDIAKVFNYLGGSEGEKQEKIYIAKAQGLREGKTLEQVENEWKEKEAQEKKSKRRRGRR